MNPCELMDAVRHIAFGAGRKILDVYEQGFTVTDKEDRSPLTEADRLSNEFIVHELENLTPDIPVLSEESAPAAPETRRGWSQFWLVDPLDGTKEFISRNGEFTVNIALIDGDRPVLGVVYVPMVGVCYSACRGGGAFKQKSECRPDPIRARAFAGGKPIVMASRSHAGPETAAFLASLGAHDTVTMGSSLKACLVAEGTADLYPRLGPTMEWDTAAAQCVVEEAGGRVLDAQGRPLTYNKPTLRNPWFIVCGAGNTDWVRHLPGS
ncbi:MAG: 3'(2'),5'-bisphosphate nucleotidase CysQ [Pseudomonadota bacterium]